MIWRSFRKLLLISIMILAFTAGIWHCQEARAEWAPTGSLLPGTYLITYINIRATTQYQIMEALGEVEITLPISDLRSGRRFEATKEVNSPLIAEFLNAEPETLPEHEPVLFMYLGDGKWKQIDLPCRWVGEGEVGV